MKREASVSEQIRAASLKRAGRLAGSGSLALALGGVLAAAGAASCCVVPFVLFVLGVGGAWIGDLTALEPYQPLFVAAALGCIGYGAYLVYWRPQPACAEASYCARSASTRLARLGLWSAALLVVIAFGFPRVARLFLGS
jgi:mercuric ion transport protein